MYRKTKTHSPLSFPQSTCCPHCPTTVATSCAPPKGRAPHTPGTRCTRAASARGAGRRSRASGQLTRSARRHKGTEDFKNWAAHISATFRLVSLCWTRLGGVRNGRDALVASDGGADADGVRTRQVRNGRDALVASDGRTDADGVRPRQARPSRVSTRIPPATQERVPPAYLTSMTIQSFLVPFPSDHFPSLSSG